MLIEHEWSINKSEFHCKFDEFPAVVFLNVTPAIIRFTVISFTHCENAAVLVYEAAWSMYILYTYI